MKNGHLCLSMLILLLTCFETSIFFKLGEFLLFSLCGWFNFLFLPLNFARFFFFIRVRMIIKICTFLPLKLVHLCVYLLQFIRVLRLANALPSINPPAKDIQTHCLVGPHCARNLFVFCKLCFHAHAKEDRYSSALRFTRTKYIFHNYYIMLLAHSKL